MKIKHISFCIAAVIFTGCTYRKPLRMTSDIDTLSYMLGVTNTQGLKEYIENSLKVDPAYMDDFYEGFKQGSNKLSKKEKAYIAGVQIGQQVNERIFSGLNDQIFDGDNEEQLSLELFLRGFTHSLKNPEKVSLTYAQKYIDDNMGRIKSRSQARHYAEQIKEEELFFSENALKEGIIRTDSGIQYRIIKEGIGSVPSDKSTVIVNYRGKLIDGTEFDSSYSRKEPSEFDVDKVIKGWTEVLTMMPAGSIWEVFIPSSLAYGADGSGIIPPYSPLIFEIELIDICE